MTPAGPKFSSVTELAPHLPRLRRLARALVRDRDEADDLVSDTVVAYLEQRSEVRGDPRPWLDAVLRNLWRLWLRGQDRRERREREGAAHALGQREDASVDGILGIIGRELDALEEPFRTTLRLTYLEGMSSFVAARRLGVPAATVRRRKQLALEHLRKRLDERFEGDRRPWHRALLLLGAALAPKASRARGPWLVAAAAAFVVATVPPAPRPAAPTEERSFAAERDFGIIETDVPSQANRPAPVVEDAVSDRRACPSLADVVRTASAGARVRVPACVYRESVVIDRPMVLEAEPGAEIRGSDIVERFEPYGSGRRSVLPVWASSATRPDCEAQDDGRCLAREQVFFDGVALTRVAAGVPPSESEFAVDGEGRLVLGRATEGHVVEAAVRSTWIEVRANDVTVRAFSMKHAASWEERLAAIDVDNPYRGLRLEGNSLADATGTLVAMGGQDHVVENNRLANAGLEALQIAPGHGVVVRGNRISGGGSHVRGRRDWRAGGVVIIQAEATIDDNDVASDNGTGIFCIACVRTRINGNRVHDNAGAGIAALLASELVVTKNRLSANGWRSRHDDAGVVLADSHDAVVEGNVLVNHPSGIRVELSADSRGALDACSVSRHNRVRANAIGGTSWERAVALDSDGHCDSNQPERNWVSGEGAAPSGLPAGVWPLAGADAEALLAVAGLAGR